MASDQDGATRWGASAEAWRRGLASIGALIAAALLIALVVLVQVSNRARDEALRRERHSYDVLVIARGLDAAMAKSEAALGRFVISGDRATGALYYDEWLQAGQVLARLREVTRGDAAQEPLIAELDALYRTRGQELAGTALRTTYRQGWTSLSLYYQAGEKPSVRLIARVLDRIADNERARLRGLSTVAEASVGRSNGLATALSGLGVLLVIGAILLGWLAVLAIARRNAARRIAEAEAERAVTLEQAVAERTLELSEANLALRDEAATRAAAEAKLAQVQKMEAVGQLTGGIAHDFNNMLAVVVGGLDLARRRLESDRGDAHRHIESALEGANRAAALTRRLLAFARAEPLLPEAIDPARLIAGMSDLIDRTLGERYRIETRLDTRGWLLWCDPSRLENAILNLAVNARDAMEGGGRLTIAAGPATLAAGEIGDLAAGDHLRIDVIDEGCGMSSELVARVFEPFFTTKPVGKGTGLGLSQIFGFARQSGGDVVIDSAPERGTTVSLFLPRHRAVPNLIAVPPAPRQIEEPEAAAGVRIVLVEDDPRVRAATIDALEELGHLVRACATGEEALAALEDAQPVDLVITDVVMPGMTGPELVDRIARTHPGTAVLFVTGYVGEAGDAETFRGHELLRKPFTVAGLARAVSASVHRSHPIERAA